VSKRSLLTIGTLAIALVAGTLFAEEHVPGQVIVKFRRGASAGAMGLQSTSVKRFSAGRATERARRFTDAMQDYAVINLPAGMTVEQALASFASNPDVESVTPNRIVKALVTPNDTEFNVQWNLHNTGQTILGVVGVADADVDASEAWDIETGASNQVIVAVLDSGIDYSHPDLAANMWINPGEISSNGIDDDANGIIDDVHGAKFNRAAGPPTGDPMDDYFHGTHVAGIIGASSNNNAGVAGICWSVKLMALKFLDSTGSGDVARGIEGIQYAVAKGASVINNSWGTGVYDPALDAAFAAAKAAGITITAAAGNDSNSSLVYYPAGLSQVIAVSGTNNRDANMARNHGPHIDIGAPGRDVLSTSLGGTYIRATGTSMATPHISAAAALLKARSPSLTPDQIQTIIVNSVDIPAAWDNRYGWGRLNLHTALRSIGDANAPTVSITSPASGSVVAGTIVVNATASDNVGVTRVQFLIDNVVRSTATIAPYTASLNTVPLADGNHTVTAMAFDGAGNSTQSSIIINVMNNDTTLPVVTLTTPQEGDIVSGVIPLAADATDNGVIIRVRFSIDGIFISSDTTAPYTGSLDTSLYSNGNHTIIARAWDQVDNVSSMTVTVNIQNNDLTPPDISITAPLPNETVGGTFLFRATATDNVTVAKVWFIFDGIVRSTDSATPFQFSYDTNSLADGVHSFVARAFDGNGNTDEDTISFTVLNNDVVPPGVGITSPADGATIGGFITVAATATDNVAVDRVRFLLDGVFHSSTTVSPYTFSLNTAFIVDGAHTLMVRAFDVAGNSSTHTITVVVQNNDATPPAVTITSPNDGAAVSGTVDLLATATDNLGVVKVHFLIDGVVRSTDTTSPYRFSFNALLETEGPHTLSARAFDIAGNNTIQSVSVTVSHTPTDLDPPTVVILSPANGGHVSGTVTINAASTDNNTVNRVECYIDGTLLATDTAAPYAFSWDSATAPGGLHVIMIKSFDSDGNEGSAQISVVTGGQANALGLFQPLFSPSKGESVSIPLMNSQTARVKARIIDRTGALIATVADGDVGPSASVSWDGRNDSRDLVASGVYIILVEIDGNTQTKKVIVRK